MTPPGPVRLNCSSPPLPRSNAPPASAIRSAVFQARLVFSQFPLATASISSRPHSANCRRPAFRSPASRILPLPTDRLASSAFPHVGQLDTQQVQPQPQSTRQLRFSARRATCGHAGHQHSATTQHAARYARPLAVAARVLFDQRLSGVCWNCPSHAPAPGSRIVRRASASPLSPARGTPDRPRGTLHTPPCALRVPLIHLPSGCRPRTWHRAL